METDLIRVRIGEVVKGKVSVDAEQQDRNALNDRRC